MEGTNTIQVGIDGPVTNGGLSGNALSSSTLTEFVDHDGTDYSTDDSDPLPMETEHHKTKQSSVGSKDHARSSALSIFGHVLRTLLLDIPLFSILLSYASLLWLAHVHTSYLRPQLKALHWDTARYQEEITYYTRKCDVDDMTTFEGADLFLSPDATPEEAYEHQLKHGFTVFKHVLSPETATNLRNFVNSRNRKLREEEKIFVIEGDNRFSFGLGTEEPSVTAAMKELANSPALRPSLEKILGPDPALIEMTAITSSYGAVAQYWHDDVVAHASAINYGRTFGPSYSVFVQLQNTTKEMGATAACPGTHYCSHGSIDVFCEKHGFQLVGEDGHWGIGDALLMNMNSYHRGAAHTDPNAPDRVMLILTFVPKPIERAESRQMSEGITFSLRWDMWGHTLNDLAAADTAMAQPWATLRALGLYKSKGSSWGIDYVTSASMRMANGDNGYNNDALEEWIERGGFKYLPSWLEGEVDMDEDEGWYQYLLRTFNLCKSFAEKLSVVSVIGYLCFFGVLAIFPFSRRNRSRNFLNATLRLGIMLAIVCCLYFWAMGYVDKSDWAADIKAGRRYASTTQYDRLAFLEEGIDELDAPSTLPNRNDVLIETRYGSEKLAMYNDYINGHPGNRYFLDLVRQSSKEFPQYPELFQNAAAEYIVAAIASNHGRFLLQNPEGRWLWIEYKDAIAHTKKELLGRSNPIREKLLRQLRFLRSDCKYGIYRDLIMTTNHVSPYLRALEKRIRDSNTYTTINAVAMDGKPIKFDLLRISRTFSLPAVKSPARPRVRSVTLSVEPEIQEPFDGAWLAAGDAAETYEDGYWYVGKIQSVSAYGIYSMSYADGTEDDIDEYKIRHHEQFYVGEKLEAWDEDEEVYEYATIKYLVNDSYVVSLDDTGKTLEVTEAELRRSGKQLRKKHVFYSNYH